MLDLTISQALSPSPSPSLSHLGCWLWASWWSRHWSRLVWRQMWWRRGPSGEKVMFKFNLWSWPKKGIEFLKVTLAVFWKHPPLPCIVIIILAYWKHVGHINTNTNCIYVILYSIKNRALRGVGAWNWSGKWDREGSRFVTLDFNLKFSNNR